MFKPRELEVGKRRITSEEFVAVCQGENISITVNPASIVALKDQSAKRFPDFDLSKYREDVKPCTVLSPIDTRGVIFMTMLALLQEKAHIRPEIVQAFADMLNSNTLPVLPTFNAGDRAIMTHLVDSITPGASSYIADKLSTTPPAPNNNECRRILQIPAASQSAFITAGHTLFQLLSLFDLSVALGLEITGLSLEPFQMAHHDQTHPHQEAIQTCNVIRNVLINSQCAGKYVDVISKNKKDESLKQLYLVPPSYYSVPDLHGVSKQVVTQFYQTSRKEIVSCVGLSATDDMYNGELVLDYIITHSKTVGYTITRLAQAIRDRLSYLLTNAKQFTAQIILTTGDDATSDEDKVYNKNSTELLQQINAITDGILLHTSVTTSDDCTTSEMISGVMAGAQGLRELLTHELSIYTHILQNKSVGLIKAQEQAAIAKQEALLRKVEEFRQKGKDDLADKLLASQNKAGGKEKKASGGLTLGNGTSQLFNTFIPSESKHECIPYSKLFSSIQSTIQRFDQVFETTLGNVVNASISTEVKMPKGTRDITPELMVIREKCFETITNIFKQHGGCGIDTPVFELRDTLMGKYGEDSKLIYDLADQGGELLSLRYDLTVPFARYCATHGVTSLKRYHIGKVYRRDQPVMTRGRFREFYQCDYDIAGDGSPMVNDSEAVTVMVRILKSLPLGSFMIKLNHRALLDAIMTVCGVPQDKLRPVCSAIDKLDKLSWENVKHEMCVDKGLDPAIADKLEQFVSIPAGTIPTVVKQLQANQLLTTNADAQRAFQELLLLHSYLEVSNVLDSVTLDMSLARGLDYYTGLIYEAVLTGVDENGNQLSFGSIAAGGRYDKLVGMFSGRDVPAVGLSIGIERVLAIIEQRERAKAESKQKKLKTNNTHVLVASNPSGNNDKYNLLLQRMKVANELRFNYNVNVEFIPNDDPNIRKQAIYAESHQIPVIVWIGVDELDKNVVSVKVITESAEESSKPVEVPRADMGTYIQGLIQQPQQE